MAKKVSEIVESLARKGGGSALYFEEQVEEDMPIAEAREQVLLAAFIPDGWDEPLAGSEQMQVYKNHSNGQIEIEVRLLT